MPSKKPEPTFSTLEEVLAALRTESDKHRRNQRTTHGVMFGLLGLVLVLTLVQFATGEFESDFFTTMLPSWVAIFSGAAALSATHKAALKAAAELRDPMLAGYLVEALKDAQEKELKQVCRSTLLDVLPRIGPEHREAFDAFQLNLLYGNLKSNSDREVVAACLQATHAIGGREAIPALEALAERADKKPDWSPLAERARQALPDLRIRAAREIVEKRVAEVRHEQELLAERAAAVEELRAR